MNCAPLLFENDAALSVFPTTRYQGSKAKIVDWILQETAGLEFETLLDAFGGTGVVGYHFKKQSKNVIYNDILKFNSLIATALIENQRVTLPLDEARELLDCEVKNAPSFVQENFKGIFYADAVYIDTPYISAEGVGTDYYDFYGFLEGLADYDNWSTRLLTQYKHKPIAGKGNPTWTNKQQIFNSFDSLFNHYQNQKLIVSYRSNGIPSVEELLSLIRKYKSDVRVTFKDYQYVLSKKTSQEVLIIAQ